MSFSFRSTLIVIAFCFFAATLASAAETSPISLGDLPLLLVDDSGIESRTGLARTVHAARTLDRPTLEPERPWEGGRLYIYGSVYPDPATGGLRMWYMSCSSLEQGSDHVLYATSPDGLRWTRPSLGLIEFAGSRDNNIVFNLHSPSVLLDPFEKDSARRYKMLGSQKAKDYRGYDAATSPDGLTWTSHPGNPVLGSSDTITLAQHPVTGEYLAYHKRPTEVRGFKRRVVWLSRSMDFNTWSKPELVLAPDEQDDAWVKQPQERTEIYNLSVFPHAAGFIGLPTMFRVLEQLDRDKVKPAQSPLDGPIDVQLVSSGDGKKWSRVAPRVNVIPRGAPGTFDGGAILGVSSTPANFGDKTWVYYTAINTGHGGTIPPKRLTIGRAEWRRDGFVSLDADPSGGRLVTKPLLLKGPQLCINADASRGEIRVGMLQADGNPIAGYALDDCEPIKADSTCSIVKWQDRSQVPTDRPVRLVIEMKTARLYSLSCGSVEGASRDAK